GSFNAVRQYVACAIILLAHRYVIDRSPLRYLLAVILAASFHVSALAMIFLYFLPTRRLRPSLLIGLCVVSAALATGSEAAVRLIEGIQGSNLSNSDYVTRDVNLLR